MIDNKVEFDQISYKNHEANMEKMLQNSERALSRLKNQNNIDNWRHTRMIDLANPIFKAGEKWLTVGDGLATDANYLLTKKLDVTASDISDSVLKIAAKENYIKNFAQENAEKLSFENQTFDYVCCKEAYHHFPKPYIALYEMLRVAKKGVVLFEPQDPILKMPFLLFLSNVLNKFNNQLLRKFWKNQYSYETVGNFVYKISEREIEKIALGMNFRFLAFKGSHDFFDANPKLTETPINQSYFSSIKRKINIKNTLSNLGLFPYQNLCAIIFKENPTVETITQLKNDGFEVLQLPINPYI